MMIDLLKLNIRSRTASGNIQYLTNTSLCMRLHAWNAKDLSVQHIYHICTISEQMRNLLSIEGVSYLLQVDWRVYLRSRFNFGQLFVSKWEHSII